MKLSKVSIEMADEEMSDDDQHPRLGVRLDMMWVEKIKEKCNWVLGDTIYAVLKNNIIYTSHVKEHDLYDLIIEPTGYVLRRYFNLYNTDTTETTFTFMIRSDSVYNDSITI